MDSRLDALISAYKVKPKKLQKKKKPAKEKIGIIKQSTSMMNIKIQSKKLQLSDKTKEKPLIKHHHLSVQPTQRSISNLSVNPHDRLRHNTSLDEDMMKLENLTVRNYNARMGLISIQQRIIEIGIKRKLNPIAEIDETFNDENPNLDNSIHLLMMRLESKQNIKERMKSLNNILIS